MYCNNCGKEVANSEKFCTNCGNQLPENNTQPTLTQLNFDNNTNTFSHTNPSPSIDDTTYEESRYVVANEHYKDTTDKRASHLGLKIFLMFVGCLFITLIVLLIMLIAPRIKDLMNGTYSIEEDKEIIVEETETEETEIVETLVEEVVENKTEEIIVEEIGNTRVAEESQYTFIEDSSHGLTYKVPIEFEKEVLDNGEVYYYFSESYGVILIPPPEDLEIETLSDYVWDSFVSGLAGTEGYSPSNDTKLKIDGVDARIHHFTLDKGSAKLTSSSVAFVSNGNLYAMGICVEEHDYEKYYYIFEDILKSITVEETEKKEVSDYLSLEYPFSEDSSNGMTYRINSEFEKEIQNDGDVYYYIKDSLGIIMTHPPTDIEQQTLTDAIWDDYVDRSAKEEWYIQSSLNDTTLRIDDVDARIHYFGYEDGTSSYTCATAIFVKDGTCYDITILIEDFYYDEYYPIFEDMLKSIKVE